MSMTQSNREQLHHLVRQSDQLKQETAQVNCSLITIELLHSEVIEIDKLD